MKLLSAVLLFAVASLTSLTGRAQDTLLTVRDQVFIGAVSQQSSGSLLVRQDKEGRAGLSLIARNGVQLVRYGDGRVYAYHEGKPTRVTRAEITPASRLHVRRGFFGDRYYDGRREIPRAAFWYKLREAPEVLTGLDRARNTRTTSKVLAIPAGIMLGLCAHIMAQPYQKVRPRFALATGIVFGAVAITSKAGVIKQERLLDRYNATL